MNIPKRCPVCLHMLLKDHDVRVICPPHFSIYFTKDRTQTISVLYLPNKIRFVWYDTTRKFCTIEGNKFGRGIYIPWVELPDRIDIDVWFSKVKTLLTFS